MSAGVIAASMVSGASVVEYSTGTGTGSQTVAVTSPVSPSDVLILLDMGSYGSAADHATTVAGLGGTWTKVPRGFGGTYAWWVGTGCSGTGDVVASGGPVLGTVNRRSARVFVVTGARNSNVHVLHGQAESSTGDPGSTVPVVVDTDQVVIGLGMSGDSTQGLATLEPASGWNSTAELNLTSTGGFYIETATRIGTTVACGVKTGNANTTSGVVASTIVIGMAAPTTYAAARYLGAQSNTTATVDVTATVASGDTLVVIEMENQQVAKHTSMSGLGGTWRRLQGASGDPNMDTLQWAVWIGTGCTGTGTITASGGTNNSGVNRRRLEAHHLVGVNPAVAAGATASQLNGTATTAAVSGGPSKIGIALGYSDSNVNALNTQVPDFGWTSRSYSIPTDNTRVGASGQRAPLTTENHQVSATRVSGTAFAGLLVVG